MVGARLCFLLNMLVRRLSFFGFLRQQQKIAVHIREQQFLRDGGELVDKIENFLEFLEYLTKFLEIFLKFVRTTLQFKCKDLRSDSKNSDSTNSPLLLTRHAHPLLLLHHIALGLFPAAQTAEAKVSRARSRRLVVFNFSTRLQ